MKEKITFHLPELVAALVFVVGLIGTILAKTKGLITFGKPTERRDCNKGVCLEHTNMIMDVGRIAEDVADTKSEMMGIRTEMKEVNEKLENLVMYHAIRNGKDLRP